MIHRLSALLALILVLLLIILPATLLSLAATETGSRWLVTRAVALAPGHLEIGQQDGTLLRGLIFNNLNYRNETISVTADHFSLAINPAALLQASLSFRTLDASDVHIQLAEAEQVAQTADTRSLTEKLPDIHLPLRISIPRAEVRRLVISRAGHPTQQLDRISLAGTAQDDQLYFQHLEIEQQPQQSIRLGGGLSIAAPYTMDIWLDWEWPLPANLEQLTADHLARGDARLRGNLNRIELDHRLQRPYVITSTGTLIPPGKHPHVEMEHQWQDLLLILPQKRSLQLAEGSLHTQGWLDDYQLSLISREITTQKLPQLAVSVKGRGDTRGFQLDQAQLTSNDYGQLNLSGRLKWVNAIQWDIHLLGEQLNPAIAHPAANGSLTLDAQVQGQYQQDKHPQLFVQLTKLSGQLAEETINAKGTFNIRKRNDYQSDLKVSAGKGEITLIGYWRDTTDLQLKVDAPDLSAFWPELRGDLQTRMQLSGTRHHPTMVADINSQQIGFRDFRLNKLMLSLHGDGSLEDLLSITHDARSIAQNYQIRFKLNTGDLTQNDVTLLTDSRLEAQGHREEHQFNWQLIHGQETVTGALTGALTDAPNEQGRNNQQWQGQLQQLDIVGPLLGQWSLQSPVAMEVSDKLLELETLCLHEAQLLAHLCARLHWNSIQDFVAELDLNSVPLAPASIFFPTEATIEGSLSAEGSLQRKEGDFSGQLSINAGSGAAIIEDIGEESYRIPWQLIRGGATIKKQQIDSWMTVELDEHNKAKGELRAKLLSGDAQLNGHIEASLDNLRWAELLVPRMRNPDGRISGELAISGRYLAPRFAGELHLAEGTAQVPELGITIDDIEVRAAADADGALRVSGNARSGENSHLKITGELDTAGDFPWAVQLAIEGEQILAVHRPDARVILDPDMQLVLDGTQLQIRGNLLVREALLEPSQLPQQAISVSRDAVIVSDTEETTPSPWTLDTDLQVSLGNRVRVQGFGLEARFSGTARIQDRPGVPLRMTGEIRVEEGRYRAYGQNLVVERGRVYFEGPPDNPGLDILAVRIIPAYTVRAGLEISGTLQEPRTRIFSVPAMSESEAMAFLLTGRPLEGASDTDATAILQALALYGIEQGDSVTGRVGDTLGLDVGFDTEGEFEQTALMLGKQLSSRLYVQYSVGLFESISTIMLRYTLSRSLSLETRSSSQAQSVDLIYRTER